mmetsp:Transcript_83009/g.232649  ORF Transcript_83009/g.232649 Transcript_83009/m.232649 type:complete len:223 (-) Transcript_83009:48-716(-)
MMSNLSILLLSAFALLLASTPSPAQGFAPPPVVLSSSTVASITSSTAVLMADQQADYGQSAELPGSYAQCGRCQSAFALAETDLGANGRGRRLECSVCGHSWFQSKDRLMTLNDGFEMVPLPEMDRERIATNMKEGKSPKYVGDSKLYVGNIAFECSENDLAELFSEVGGVGSVALVRDDQGRNRGFGFVTMRTKEEGDAAIEKLNGMELNGRNIAVRESNN